MTDDPKDFSDWDAAYILGALSPEDRRAYEKHLAETPASAAELSELAGLPGVLKGLTPEEAVALLYPVESGRLESTAHQPGAVSALARSVNRRRRRIRAGLISAAIGTAALLVVGTIVVGGLRAPTEGIDSPNATGRSTAMSPVVRDTVTARLTVTPKPWGTLLNWNCDYSDLWTAAPQTLDLVVTSTSGIETVVASWTASGAKGAGLAASTSVAAADIRTVSIRTADTASTLVETDL